MGLTSSWGACRVVVVVSAELVLVCLALSVSIHAAFAWRTAEATRRHGEAVSSALLKLERGFDVLGELDLELPPADQLAQTLQTELSAIIEDTLGAMHVPTAADHLMGAVSQWGNLLMMRKFGGPEGIAALMGGVPTAENAAPLTDEPGTV